MVSGVDIPSPQGPQVEASTNIATLNQARGGSTVATNALVVGKQFQAEVVASLSDGTYVVKVADIAARMQLPDSPQIGSKVSLTLITTSPRPTFLLSPPDGELGSSAPVTTSATLGATVRQLIDEFQQSSETAGSGATGLSLQAGSAIESGAAASTAPRLFTLQTSLPDSAPAVLSSTARLVDQLSQTSGQSSPLTGVTRLPLLDTPEVSVNTMMSALQNGVSNSGMFYESHLQQWIQGNLPTEQLLKEPQAQFATAGAQANNSIAAPVPDEAAATEAAIPAGVTTAPQSTDSAALPAGTTLASPATQASAANAGNAPITLSHDATSIIQQQLQTMEQQRFVWHGELWPGQTMDWEISEDGKGQRSSDNPTGSNWQSTVRFELPQLGAVSAQLHLAGNRLRLQISTENEQNATLLKSHAHELASSLDLAGTRLESILISTTPAHSS